MKVLIQSMTGEVVSLEIELSDSIKRVKEKLQEVMRIPSSTQKLLYDQTCLKDANTVESYNIQENSLLLLGLKLERNIQIFVRTPKDKLLSFIVETFDTIESVKNKIQRLNNKNPDQQKLLFGGEELENGRTLGSYNVKNNSTLSLRDRNIQIFIKFSTGTYSILQVDSSDTIRKVKEEIQRNQGILPEEQKLFYLEEELDERLSLASYNILNNSTLNLLVSEAGENLKIYLRNLVGKTLVYEVKSFYTILSLKLLIAEKEGIVPDKQRLIFARKELENERTFAHYNIQAESTISMVMRLSGC